MKTFYKVFLVLFIIFIAINVYALDWRSDLFDEDNIKHVFSLAAGILGLIVVFILNSWSKLAERK